MAVAQVPQAAQALQAHWRPCAALAPFARYVRHRPEDTVLYGVVEEHLESFYRVLGERGTSLPAPRRTPMSWMQRLRYVFDIDLRRCPRCGAALRVLAVITDPRVIAAILEHIDTHAARAPPIASA